MTAGTGSDIGSSGWTAGIGSPGIRSFGSTAGAPHHLARHGHRVIWQGSGLRINRHDSGHRVIRYRIVWLDSGHWVTRHQVIWLASGHRVIWQGSGHRVTRHWIVGSTAGTAGSPGMTAGTGSPGIRSFGSPAGTASSGKAVGTES
ncbi:unnamed protein product, partial [Staurois parvus]